MSFLVGNTVTEVTVPALNNFFLNWMRCEEFKKNIFYQSDRAYYLFGKVIIVLKLRAMRGVEEKFCEMYWVVH